MKTLKQLYARDMTKTTTKLTMRLDTIYIQSINARRVTTKKHKGDIVPQKPSSTFFDSVHRCGF